MLVVIVWCFVYLLFEGGIEGGFGGKFVGIGQVEDGVCFGWIIQLFLYCFYLQVVDVVLEVVVEVMIDYGGDQIFGIVIVLCDLFDGQCWFQIQWCFVCYQLCQLCFYFCVL